MKQNQRCLFDYVMVEDVSNEAARILGRFCGSFLPAGKLTGQKLRITYKSEHNSQRYGFKLKWSKIGRSIKKVAGQGILFLILFLNFPYHHHMFTSIVKLLLLLLDW